MRWGGPSLATKTGEMTWRRVTEESEEEALVAGGALAMLTEPAISCCVGSYNDERCPHPGPCALWSTAHLRLVGVGGVRSIS